MDFTFTDEQRLMAAALRELTADICAASELRAVFDKHDRSAEDRWQSLAEMGLFGVLAPSSAGGMGLGDPDFVLLAEECGWAALPEPLTEQAALVVPALAELTDEPAAAALLPRIIAGEVRVGIAHARNLLPNTPPGLTHWLLCTNERIALAEADAVAAPALASVDAGRRLRVPEFTPTTGVTLARGAPARALAARLANRGAVYAAAECLGVGSRLLALSADYAKERTQFGKPIGAYQGIKHHLANVALKLEFARPVVYAAVTRAASAGERSDAAASHAKLAAGDAAELAARTGIQVHGAMGYSWELDLHFFMKRAWALQGAWGERSFHARRIQQLVCGGALALGPDQTFARAATGSHL